MKPFPEERGKSERKKSKKRDGEDSHNQPLAVVAIPKSASSPSPLLSKRADSTMHLVRGMSKKDFF